MKDLLPVLELVAKTGKTIACPLPRKSTAKRWPPWWSTSCAGPLHVCAVKAPGSANRRKAILTDIAVLTAVKPSPRISSQVGKPDTERSRPGQDHHHRQGHHDPDRRRGQEGRHPGAGEQIRSQMEDTTSEYDREKLQERLAKIVGGVARDQGWARPRKPR